MRLPYGDDVFHLVFSIAVLEHLAHPERAVSEMYRVLRPGRYFIGTVAFLEPFHDNSFFHFSHLGLWSVLRAQRFEVETIFCIEGWDVARAQIEMGFGARLPRWLTRALIRPFTLATMGYACVGRTLTRD